MDAIPREILICQTDEGREPFESGNLGDTRSVGEGVIELRIDFGPGYRVYFGQVGNEVHLISGGSKQTQDRDIRAAKSFWRIHG